MMTDTAAAMYWSPQKIASRDILTFHQGHCTVEHAPAGLVQNNFQCAESVPARTASPPKRWLYARVSHEAPWHTQECLGAVRHKQENETQQNKSSDNGKSYWIFKRRKQMNNGKKEERGMRKTKQRATWLVTVWGGMMFLLAIYPMGNLPSIPDE